MTQPPDLDWADLDGPEPPGDAPANPREGVPPTSDSACQAERERVLRHPEVAIRLTQPPISYARAEQWNGYVPPEMWRERHNDAPQRAALLSIIAAAVALERDQESTP